MNADDRDNASTGKDYLQVAEPAPYACDVIYSLLEAIPGQTEDRDWWPDELTRAVDAAKAYLKHTCACDPNVNYFDGECVEPGHHYRTRIATLKEALERVHSLVAFQQDDGRTREKVAKVIEDVMLVERGGL